MIAVPFFNAKYWIEANGPCRRTSGLPARRRNDARGMDK